MKIKLLFILLILDVGFTSAYAQTKLSGKFRIEGDVTSIPSAYLAFFYHKDAKGEHVTDSARVIKGHFQFSGYLEEPYEVQILLFKDRHGERKSISEYLKNNLGECNFLLEPGIIHIRTNDSLLKEPIITSSVLNTYYKEFNQKEDTYAKPIKSLVKQLNTTDTANHVEINRLEAEIKKGWDERSEKVAKPFFMAHLDNYISLYVLKNSFAGVKLDTPTVGILFDKLPEALKNYPSAIRLKERIAATKTVTVGKVAPSFEQPDSKGKVINLASYKGKYLLIDFWASWCVPCRMENPNVTKAYKKYKGKNFAVLSISIDTQKKSWLQAVKEDNLEWEQVSDLKPHNEAARLYGVAAIPQNFLIDPNGKIIAQGLRGDALEKKLANLLGNDAN